MVRGQSIVLFMLCISLIVIGPVYLLSLAGGEKSDSVSRMQDHEGESAIESETQNTEEKSNSFSRIQIVIEREDHSVRSSSGDVLAAIYYDKPVIVRDSDAARAVNKFFDEEYQTWLCGSGRLTEFHEYSIERFIKGVDVMREIHGDYKIAQYPFCYSVDTEIILLTDGILSIKQTCRCLSSGPSDTAYYGSTFDLHTGERLPLNSIVDIDADTFRKELALYLVDKFNTTESNEEPSIMNYYGPNETHDFDTYINGHVYQLNYEYYYDGEYFYLPEQYFVFIAGTATVLKWNGKSGDDFKMSLER